ncbi:MAG: hypothetical protein IH899_11100 [Planctomycetes bacterium]|nr:hypothetical protein [Planctomycetota bacterium]
MIDVKLLGELFLPSQEIEFSYGDAETDVYFFNLAGNKLALYPARIDKFRDDFQQWVETEYDPSDFIFDIVG